MSKMQQLNSFVRPKRHLSLLLLLAGAAHVQCTSSDGDPPSSEGSGGSGGSGPPAGTGALSGTGGAASSGGSSPSGGVPGSGGMVATGGGPITGCVLDLDCDPEPLPKTGDFGQDCVDRINQFRVDCHCLPPLERWTEGEACAQANAEYDQGTDTPHSGWPDAACSDPSGPLSRSMAGSATNECPRYRDSDQVIDLCLLQMYHEGDDWASVLGRPPTEMDYNSCRGSCYGTYGHFIAMTRERNTKVACGITSSGEIWSVQNFD